MTIKSQNVRVKDYLEEGNKLTPIEALDKFGSFRLAAIIHDLRKEGMNILSHMHTHSGKKYAVYQYVPEGDEIKVAKSNWMMPEWG
jgi:hypothetical protein